MCNCSTACIPGSYLLLNILVHSKMTLLCSFKIYKKGNESRCVNCISTAYHAMLTLMVFKLLLCLSLLNLTFQFAVMFFGINQRKVRFADHYAAMTPQ